MRKDRDIYRISKYPQSMVVLCDECGGEMNMVNSDGTIFKGSCDACNLDYELEEYNG